MFGFKKRSDRRSILTVAAPADGRLIALEEVPDPVFSRGLAGPGFAVVPSSGKITAPIAGTVILVPETHHAVGIRTADGAEVLVHVGIDSVTLKGEGLTSLVEVGDEVEQGTPVLEVDLPLLSKRLPSVATPVVITNADQFEVSSADLTSADRVVTITTP